MKKKCVYLLTGLTAVLLLTACGGTASKKTSNETAEAETTAVEEEPAEVSDEDAINDPNEGLGGDIVVSEDDPAFYEGIWLPTKIGDYIYLEIDEYGYWTLYGDTKDIAGWLGYDDDLGTLCAYEYNGDWGALFLEDDGTIMFSSYGHYEYSSMGLTEDQETASYADEDFYQVPVSNFKGVWYLNGDLDADCFIVINKEGTWSYYERINGDPEAAEMDYGELIPSDSEMGTFYAKSYPYDLMYRMFDFDTDMITWDGDSYERID